MSIEEAKTALWKAPAWAIVTSPSAAEKDRLIDALVEICRLETPMLRRVVRSFMEDLKPDKLEISKVGEWSKIYILNRIAFDVPLEHPLGTNRHNNVFFGGWVGVPVHDRKVNLRWPIDYGPHLTISGEYGGYRGEGYAGEAEFAFFAEHFPRRK